MQDSELKKILLETCPVLPGQESRAWNALRDRLHGAAPARSSGGWLPVWRTASVPLFALGLFVLGLVSLSTGGLRPVPLASAQSVAPGIYATSFYSHDAGAQVVWVDGLEAVSDRPTYQDPSGPAASTDEPSSL